MTSQRNLVIRFGTLGTAALAAVSGAAPAMAEAFEEPLAVNNPLLLASLVLFVVAMCLRAVRRARDTDAAVEAPDLRWWKNPQTEPRA